MNKKVLAALVTTLALGTASVARAGDDVKPDPPGKEAKGKKGGKDDKKDTKAAKPTPPPLPPAT